MIYGDSGPFDSDEGYPMPTVKLHGDRAHHHEAEAPISTSADTLWFERVEGSERYPLQFHTKGEGPVHTLVPLNRIMDERYSVYVRNEAIA
jgi:hypothetical protein